MIRFSQFCFIKNKNEECQSHHLKEISVSLWMFYDAQYFGFVQFAAALHLFIRTGFLKAQYG